MKSFVACLAIVASACALVSGCASVISGRHADVSIDSYPSNARVVIRDNEGRQVASCNTPGTVSLRRNRRYFLPARYTATVEAPGYAPTELAIRSTMNPWIVGNIAIGGIPGLIVDNATGAAWKPSQSELHTQLAPLGGPQLGPMYSNTTPTPTTPPDPAAPVPQLSERTSGANLTK